ncbi:hypothetical protein [Rhizobium leucaenae]|uniref:Uncharacterized protein n=1 Tax=Rhizobium leucaenae TaxID=29450 RepID=A0A7W6ZXM7_9HYPH|nr:hypothetical protein [Rhizobium leucaenae]MBB4570596.1 hypothetical protein [Rhizobium leucaenae]
MTDDIEVRIYQEHPDGDPEELTSVDIEYFGGICPNVGDIFVTWNLGTPYGYFLVEKRYFIVQQGGPRGWAVYVRDLKPTPFDQRMVAQWAKDTEFFASERDDDEDGPAYAPIAPPDLPKSKRVRRKKTRAVR